MCSVKTRAERLKWARERAGFASAAEAARKLDVPEVTYRAHEKTEGPGARTFDEGYARRYGAAFGVSWSWLLTGDGHPDAAPDEPSTVTTDPVAVPRFGEMPKTVPVYGTVVGGVEGDFEFNGEVVDMVRRPPGIASTKGVFALYVNGDSMEPRYRAGALIYLNPSRPARPGDDVVIELFSTNNDGGGAAYIKTLRGRTSLALVCEQYNPAKTVEYPLAKVKAVYRVMTLEELLGV